MKTLSVFAVLFITLLAGNLAPSAQMDEVVPLDDDERLIDSAGLPSEGPMLLEFFRSRAKTEVDSARINDLIKRFTGSSFAERLAAGADLISLGPLAVPGLRRVMNDFEAAEVRARAKRCLEWVEGSKSASLASAAARVVAKRKPAGAVEALLAYLPYADNEDVAREVTVAMQAVALANGKTDPVLVRALSDPVPVRRAAAGAVLSQIAPGEHREAYEKLLNDPNPEVRLGSAVVLAKARNAAAIPVLINLIPHLPINKRTEVEEFLQDMAGEWAPAGGPAGEDEIARRIRRDAWAAWWKNTDGPALQAMLTKRTLTNAEQAKVKAWIRKLGDKSFTVREQAVSELVTRGTMILPLLREALKDADLEVSRRAQRCIKRIEQEPAHRLPSAAIRLLALRRPAGATETLVNYLPFAEDETLAEEVQSAMGWLAMKDGKPDPVLVEALDNFRPGVRIAAAAALAKGGGPDARPLVRKLMTDKDTNVRLRTALALATHDAEAIPVLIELIGVLEDEKAGQAHDFLCQLAGEKAPGRPEDSSEARKKCSADWAAWWKDNSAKIDLARLTAPQSRMLGFTVICEANTGQVVEIGRDGKQRWSFGGVLFPVDAWVLPGNRVLVAECNGAKVTERDLKGTILWQRQGLNGSPVNVQRLPNGNTFIATNVNLLEVDRKGKDVMTIGNVFGGITAAYKAKNGHIIVVSQNGQCLRLDSTGKQLKMFNSGRVGGWTSGIDLLPNGRILIAQPNNNKVVEFDPDGKVIMEFNAPQVTTATGLPNGNILAASSNTRQVLEIDRRGRTVWTYQAGPGGAFRARRR
jgi:HEAT repeat protein